jgi:hypothetical protein
VLFIFRIILLTHYAHTLVFILEVNFNFSGSSMDSFTLGLLAKIDFSYEHINSTTATARELADLHNFSLKYTL